jgi:hypothetical protein
MIATKEPNKRLQSNPVGVLSKIRWAKEYRVCSRAFFMHSVNCCMCVDLACHKGITSINYVLLQDLRLF